MTSKITYKCKRYFQYSTVLILILFLSAERLRKLEASVVDIAVEARLDKFAVAVCTESRMITDVRIIGTNNLYVLVIVPAITPNLSVLLIMYGFSYHLHSVSLIYCW